MIQATLARNDQATIAVLARDISDDLEAFRQNVESLRPFFPQLAVVLFENDSSDGSREAIRAWADDTAQDDRAGYHVDLMECDEAVDCKFGKRHRDTNTGDYVPFTLPINYLRLDDAELAQVLIRSTRNTADATVGTTLWIDELRFTGITGINTLQDEMIGFTLYPNPTRDLLQVENLVEDRAYFQLMDRMGAVCHSSVLSTGQQWVDVSELNSGLYIYQFRNNAGTLLQSGKINLIR